MRRRDVFAGGLGLVSMGLGGAAPSAGAADSAKARVAGQDARGAGADLAITNANIVTLEPSQPRAQAVLVRAGRIALIGDNAAVLGARGSAPVFDAGNRTVVPGFIDAHVHFELTTAFLAYMVDAHTPPLKSLKEIFALLKKKAAETQPGRWVVGRGDFNFNAKVAENRFPTRLELDAISDTQPVILFSGLHVAMLNTVALKALHLWDDKEASNLTWRNGVKRIGTTVHRDEGGTPTGVVTEIADLFYNANPYTVEEYKASILKFADAQFVSKGVTSIADIPKGTFDIRAIQELNVADKLPLRMRYYIHTPLTIDIDAQLNSGLTRGFGNDMLRFGGMKIFVDGIGGDGLGKRYPDVKWDQDGLNETVWKAHNADLQVIMHCVTPTAFNMAVAAVAAAQAKERKNLLHRIEHVGYLGDPAEIKRLVDLGIRVTVTRVGPAEAPPRPTPAMRTMAEMGLEPMAVSDSTGTLPNFSPMGGIASMMLKPEEGGAFVPEQALTFDQALRAFTLWPARAMHEDHVKGSIALGKLGDFAVLSADPTKTTGRALFGVGAVATILGGRLIYEKA
jgi:hypothetical protein